MCFPREDLFNKILHKGHGIFSEEYSLHKPPVLLKQSLFFLILHKQQELVNLIYLDGFLILSSVF